MQRRCAASTGIAVLLFVYVYFLRILLPGLRRLITINKILCVVEVCSRVFRLILNIVNLTVINWLHSL